MTIKTFTHLYDTYDQAAAVVSKLEAAGVPHSDISLVGSNHDNRVATTPTTATGTTDPVVDTETKAGTGASVGTLLGGGAGLLAGIGALAIPGVGPLVAAGWLVATLTGAGAGAAAGGLLGSLTGAGVHEKDAHVYAEGVRRGGTLVTVRANDASTTKIESILADSGAVDVAARRTSYESNDWSKFDDTAAGYGTSEVEAERARHVV